MIGTRQTNATQWTQEIGRQNVTVMNWVHHYNAAGPEVQILIYTSVSYERRNGTQGGPDEMRGSVLSLVMGWND